MTLKRVRFSIGPRNKGIYKTIETIYNSNTCNYIDPKAYRKQFWLGTLYRKVKDNIEHIEVRKRMKKYQPLFFGLRSTSSVEKVKRGSSPAKRFVREGTNCTI